MGEIDRRPDELAAVRELLKASGPTADVVHSGRASLLAELATATTTVSAFPEEEPKRELRLGAMKRQRPMRWAFVRNGLAGAAAAVALALAVGVPSGSLARLSPDPTVAPSRGPEARQILLAAAGATAKAPSDGAYWRTSVVTGQLILSPDRRYVIKRESARETWLTRRYGVQDRWSGRYLGASPATMEDEAAWRAAGQPTAWQYPADVTGLGKVAPKALVGAAPGEARSGPHRVRWRDAGGILTKQLIDWKALRTIPTDPTALRAFLVTHIAREKGAYVGREMEAELRATCLELITALPVRPEVRSAAYQILASIPGMRPEGAVTDPLGRMGQGLSYQNGLDDERLVIDPESGLPLAAETRSRATTDDGREVQIGYFTAYKQIGWTDEGPMK
ncbi:hypothetical protein GCM10022419_098740 [Nonomuraea rosea]|uniref:CU044_5270 family protein n=1 Tax=Nonomuraea rosea TaxID=638574 RepID=A0ABP6Z6Z0_9ACTN